MVNLESNYCWTATAAAKSLQSCPTLCDPIDGSPSGSTIPGIPGKNTGVGCHFLLQLLLEGRSKNHFDRMNGERFKMIRNSYKFFESKNKKKEEIMMREKQRA